MSGGRTGVRGLLARWRGRDIELKSPDELDAMRAAGGLVAGTLAAVIELARPGVSTKELDALAEQTIRDAGAVPSFLGYHGYPASICASVNEQIVHGIPSATQVLADGDLVSVDCGAILEGWHGDAAVTILVGCGLRRRPRAVGGLRGRAPRRYRGGPAGRPALRHLARRADGVGGGRASATGSNYGIVAEYGGHGIGTSMHMDPFLPNFGDPGQGPRLVPGMALAVEPMLTAGDPETRELEDGWTVVTADGSRAVHWEHTVAITEDGPRVLTLPLD